MMTDPTLKFEASPARDPMQALGRGFRCRCPNCGKGSMFRAFLKVRDNCLICGEELHHQQADDAPAYFVIAIVGHIIVTAVLSVEMTWAPPYWVHAVIWLPAILGLSIGLLQPIKGAIVGWQWAFRMHGFNSAHADPGLDGLPAVEAKSVRWTTLQSS